MSDCTKEVVGVAVAVGILSFLIGCLCGGVHATHEMRREAALHGHGVFKLDPGDGATRFVWLPTPTEKLK